MIRAAGIGLAVLLLICPPLAAQQTVQEDLSAQADAGDSAAQTELAFQYHQGTGVAQNFTTAALWASRAAAAGEARAQNLLGRYYHTGLGVERDQAQALRWLGAAAETGTPDFVYDLGFALENGADGSSDLPGAAAAYARAAEAGHPEALVSLGLLYQEGQGLPQDYARARALYEQAASSGHPRAQNNLGLLYVRGHGVPQDYETAAKLFAQAAEQGLPGALRNLGVMYENGFGVDLDEARAAELYRMAGQGADIADTAPGLAYDPRLAPPPQDEAALTALGQMAVAGDPVAQFQIAWLLVNTPEAPPAALYQAAQYFAAAARAGHGPAMRNLGLLYFEGRGVPQDYVLGRMWLTLAGSVGQADAATLIQQLGTPMTADQINEAQTRADAWVQKNL